MFALKLFTIKAIYMAYQNFTKQIVPSTHLFQNFMYSVKVGTNAFSRYTIKISANTRPNGEPLATLKKVFPPKLKYIFFVQRINNSFSSFFHSVV